jgi:hypothetical protein
VAADRLSRVDAGTALGYRRATPMITPNWYPSPA